VLDESSISRKFIVDGFQGGRKLIFDGKDYFLSVNKNTMSLFYVKLSSPTLTCPSPQLKQSSDDEPIFGRFDFVLNTTTRTCPTKLRKYDNSTTSVEKFEHVCVFTKNFTIEFVEPYFCKNCTQSYIRN